MYAVVVNVLFYNLKLLQNPKFDGIPHYDNPGICKIQNFLNVKAFEKKRWRLEIAGNMCIFCTFEYTSYIVNE
jgi:hypothetical protein